jgi:hypothetical protein
MAAKKKAKSVKKVPSKAKAAGKNVAKKVTKKAKTFLGRIAQVSAQLVLDSGVLGEVPKRKASKKVRARKA